MGLGDNVLASVFLAIAMVLLITLVSYAFYEYRKRKNRLASESDESGESMLCDTNKEIVVYHKGTPVTLRLIQTPSGIYCRILDECQEVLLAENAETVAVIDRVEHLCIGSTDFDRSYAAVLAKYQQSESLRGMSFQFSVMSLSGSGVLQNATAESYAEAELIGTDGLLRVYSRNRRRTSLLHGRTCMLSVEWIFPISGAAQTEKCTNWESFGRIYDTNGCVKYDLKLSANPKKAHKYALFHAYDKKHASKSECEFLRITGSTQLTTWAASQTGMSKTALVFKIFARALDGDKKIQIATIEPAIDSGGGASNSAPAGGTGSSTNGNAASGNALSPPQQETRRNSLTSTMFTNNLGDQLYSIKYKSNIVDPDTKSAILGVAFLLCLRHCMKSLYRTFERLALSK